jgi:hypothetical protein
MSSLNTFTDITFPDCENTFQLGAIPTDQNCLISPILSQVSDLYIKAENAPAPFTWAAGAPSLNDEGIGNNVPNNNRSKWLVGKGGIPDPEETVYQGPKLKEVVGRRVFQLTFETEIYSKGQRDFLRQLQSNWSEYTFWIGSLGGRLFGGEDGIVPYFSNAILPLRSGNEDTEIGIIVIEFAVDGPGVPVADNPARNYVFPDAIPTLIEDGNETVIIDDSGVAIGYY